MHLQRRMTSKSFFFAFATAVLLVSSGCASVAESPGAVATLRVMRERGPCRAHVGNHDVVGCHTAS
jgi:hypothetical protein